MNPMNGSNTGTSNNKKVSLNELAELTGFPVSMIQSELKLGENELDLEDLRNVLAQYLDRTFVLDEAQDSKVN